MVVCLKAGVTTTAATAPLLEPVTFRRAVPSAYPEAFAIMPAVPDVTPVAVVVSELLEGLTVATEVVSDDQLNLTPLT